MDAFGLHFGVEPRLSIYFASGAVAISSVALYHRHRNTANNQDLVFDGLPIWYTEQDVLTSRGDISLSVPEPTVTIKIATKTFQAVALQAHDAARRKLTTQKSDSQFNSIYNSSAPSLAALIVYPLLLLVAGMSMVLATLSHVVSAGNHRNIVLGPITKEQFAVLPSQTPSSFDKSQVAGNYFYYNALP
jgi:hypothetical protein